MRFCRLDGGILESLDNIPTEILTKRFDKATPLAISAQKTALSQSLDANAERKITGDLVSPKRNPMVGNQVRAGSI